jgi:hypothetical protein
METTYRDAAIVLWGEAGEIAHDEYAHHRAAYFGERIPEQVPIVIGITAYAHCMGLCEGHWEYGPRITLESRQFARGRQFVSDIILHEMIHAALFADGVDWHHKSEAWYAEVRRLTLAHLGINMDDVIKRGSDRKSVREPNPAWTGPGCGVPRTLVRKVRDPGAIPHGDIATWPHSFRPTSYAGDPPIPCPSY